MFECILNVYCRENLLASQEILQIVDGHKRKEEGKKSLENRSFLQLFMQVLCAYIYKKMLC